MRFAILGFFIGIILVTIFRVATGLLKYHDKLIDMKQDIEKERKNN